MSKKGGKKGKAQENDESTQKIMRCYSHKVNSLGLAQNKIFVAAVALAIENQDHVKRVLLIFIYSYTSSKK